MNTVGPDIPFYPHPGGLTPQEFDSYLTQVGKCKSICFDDSKTSADVASAIISEEIKKQHLDTWSLGRLYTIALFHAPLRLRDGDEEKIFDLGKTITITIRLTSTDGKVSVRKQSAFLLGKKRREFLSGKPIGFIGIFEGVQIEILNMENSL